MKDINLLNTYVDFVKLLLKITKQLGFHPTLKTADLQDNIYTTLGDNIRLNFVELFSYVPIFIPDAQTQIMFIDSIKNSFTLSFDSWSTDRKTVDTQLEYQVDIGSAQNSNSPNDLITVHQAAGRVRVPNNANIIGISDHLDVRKYRVDIDGVRYPGDGFNVDYGSNDYVDQYRDLKLLYGDYVGEELLSLFISYPDMKNKYPIQLIDLRFQVDHNNPKKKGLFEEYRGATNKARLFVILIKHRENKMI